MANEKKINAIADAEQAGLYYSSNTEEGFTRKVEGENQIFLNSKGKPIKGKRDLKRIEEMRIPPAWTCLLYTSPSPRDSLSSRMPSSA